MKDLIGQAIYDYYINEDPADLITETSISEADVMPVEYFFREFSAMPEIEQVALMNTYGKVLDVGCGAGSHALYLQNRNIEVVAIDISPLAIKTCALRGVKNAMVADIMQMEGQFDTILLMMNGTGICGELENLTAFLAKLKSLLAPGGQILIDSSDIVYMYTDEQEFTRLPEKGYYGELTFYVKYKNQMAEPFPWLYTDFAMLEKHAHHAGLQAEVLLQGEHYDYLARLY
ncbi:MAG: class I SAM-dependent methyltransferase [Flavobacterium sp.]|nr:class I SAM-dependent methyltransferase [Flavobacterium sp.]